MIFYRRYIYIYIYNVGYIYNIPELLYLPCELLLQINNYLIEPPSGINHPVKAIRPRMVSTLSQARPGLPWASAGARPGRVREREGERWKLLLVYKQLKSQEMCEAINFVKCVPHESCQKVFGKFLHRKPHTQNNNNSNNKKEKNAKDKKKFQKDMTLGCLSNTSLPMREASRCGFV